MPCMSRIGPSVEDEVVARVALGADAQRLAELADLVDRVDDVLASCAAV